MTRDEAVARLIEILPNPHENDQEITEIFYVLLELGQVQSVLSELWNIGDGSIGEMFNVWTADLRIAHNA